MSEAAQDKTTMLDIALRYAAAGFHVMPLNGKIPRTQHGSKDATRDEAQIRKWWGMWPSADIGIATGHDGLCVIDADGDDGALNLAALEEQYGKLPTDTFRVRTGRDGGGLHIYVRTTRPVRNSQSRKNAWEHVDVRGQGGLTVAPPSIHRDTGRAYRCVSSTIEVADCPPGWEDALCLDFNRSIAGGIKDPGQHMLTPEALVPHGARHDALVSEAGRMRDRGWTHDAMFAALRAYADTKLEDGASVPDENLQRIAASMDIYPVKNDAAAEAVTAKDAHDILRATMLKLKHDPGYVFTRAYMDAYAAAVERSDHAALSHAKDAMRKKKVMSDFDKAFKEHVAAERVARVEDSTTPIEVNLDMPPGWMVRREGVYQETDDGLPEQVLPVPLTITRRLKTVGDQDEKVELEWIRDDETHVLMVERSLVGQARSLPVLADRGLPVTSDNATKVVRYLAQLEAANMAKIPLERCCTQAGWIGTTNFYPGAEADIEFAPPLDSAITPRSFAAAGEMETWVDGMLPLLRAYPLLRLQVAASFAAPLLRVVGHRSFVVHVHGDSGGGKTATLLAAMSVWGNPRSLMANFNTTAVGLEQRMGLFNGMPVGLNERQAANRAVDDLVYMAGEGTGRTRGAKAGGLRKMATWQMILLTNGEEPLVSQHAPQGARTRTIEVAGSPIDDDEAARDVYPLVEGNYGWAGRAYAKELVDLLATDGGQAGIVAEFTANRESLAQLAMTDVIPTHVSAIALLLTADTLMDRWVFGGALGADTSWLNEVIAQAPRLGEQGEAEREYRFALSIMTMNYVRFRKGWKSPGIEGGIEEWGVIDDGVCYFHVAAFDREFERAGFRPVPAKRRLHKMGVMDAEKNGKHLRYWTRIRQQPYVAVHIPDWAKEMLPNRPSDDEYNAGMTNN